MPIQLFSLPALCLCTHICAFSLPAPCLCTHMRVFSLCTLCLCTHMCAAALCTHKEDPSLKRYDVPLARPFFKGKFELIVLDVGLRVYIF